MKFTPAAPLTQEERLELKRQLEEEQALHDRGGCTHEKHCRNCVTHAQLGGYKKEYDYQL